MFFGFLCLKRISHYFKLKYLFRTALVERQTGICVNPESSLKLATLNTNQSNPDSNPGLNCCFLYLLVGFYCRNLVNRHLSLTPWFSFVSSGLSLLWRQVLLNFSTSQEVLQNWTKYMHDCKQQLNTKENSKANQNWLPLPYKFRVWEAPGYSSGNLPYVKHSDRM